MGVHSDVQHGAPPPSRLFAGDFTVHKRFHRVLIDLEPAIGLEPMTCALRVRSLRNSHDLPGLLSLQTRAELRLLR